MEEHKKKLEQFFCPYKVPEEIEVDFGDESDKGEYWKYNNPEDVEYWSIVLYPMIQRLSFKTKYLNGTDAALPLSHYEEIVDITRGPGGLILVTCVIKDDPDMPEEYRYTFVLDLKTTPFSIQECCKSLMHTNFAGMLKELESHIDRGRWNKDGGPLPPQLLETQLRQLLNSFQKEISTIAATQRSLQPIHLSRETSGVAGSQQSRLNLTPETRKSGTQRRQAKQSKTIRASTSDSLMQTRHNVIAQEAAVEQDPESSTLSVLTNIPKDLKFVPKDEESGKANYVDSLKICEQYWSDCQDAYVFKEGMVKVISIDQLETPPPDMNCRTLEEEGVDYTMHYLLEMPDKDRKQALCAMPIGLDEMPTEWEDIQHCQFYMIDGQHSVAASKKMRTMDVSDAILKKFEKWECHIVWSKDSAILRQISSFYNRVNHFERFTPTWATNIIGARGVWEKMGKPTPG